MNAKLRILVVEGQQSSGQAIAGLLRRRGHAVHLVASAEAALPLRMAELLRAVESDAGPTAPEPGRFDRDYASVPASVELAARELAAYALQCGISPAARARIASATAEIVDNARRHGYCQRRGRIRVEGQLDGADFSVRVSDEGIGFDAAALGAGGLHDTLRHGLARARALSEELEVESRPDGGTRVLLVFRASRVVFEEENGVDLSELDFLGPELSRRILQTLREGKGEELYQLSPALAVVVGRLLSGPDPRASIEQALWS